MYLSSQTSRTIAPYGFSDPSGWSWGLGDVASVQSQVSAAASKWGVPEWLALAVAKAESAFNPSAKSSAGAIGVMQLMPATAAGLHVDPYDSSQNIDGGVHLLATLLKQYNGDASLALAAYNAGPGAVAKYGGVPPYAETQNYVAKILGGSNVSDMGATQNQVWPVGTAASASPSVWSDGETALSEIENGLSPLAWGAIALGVGATLWAIS